MSPEFLRRYYIIRILTKPKAFGFTSNFVPLERLQQTLVNIKSRNQEDVLYQKLEHFSRKTINRDIRGIESFLKITISHKRNAGFYVDEDALDDVNLKEVYENTELYLLNHHAHSWKEHITTAKTSLSDYVDIVALINAIDQTYLVKLEYNGWYADSKFQTFKGIVQPLHIKDINNAWYLIAHDEKTGIQSFCLDKRIENLEITNKHPQEVIDFDEKEYFENTIGILKTAKRPQWIYLKVANHHYKYLYDNPICEKQVLLNSPKRPETEVLDYNDPDMWGEMKIYVEPNYEFLMEIFKYNLWVKVIAPEPVKQEVKHHLKLMMAYYE